MVHEVKVPYYDHAAEYCSMKSEIDSVISRVLYSGKYRHGKEVSGFEKEFAKYCSVQHVVATGSCSVAMLRTLLAFGIGHGDEVITVPNTNIACTAAIHHAGASVVFVDIDEQTYNINPAKIEVEITPRTKCIMVVHMYGHPASMDPILEVAKRHNLFVLEDAASAVGAQYKGKRVGTIGHGGCFSHSPTKILGSFGDGGSAATNDSDIAARIRKLFLYYELESEGGYTVIGDKLISVEGYHGRMSEILAAVLRVRLKKLDEQIARRREIAAMYRNLLERLPVILPFESKEVEHVYRNFVIRVKSRNKVRGRLAEKGVETVTHFVPPLHLQPVYRNLNYHEGQFPVTESVSAKLLSLPIHPTLTQEQIEWVAMALKESIY